MKKLFSLLLTGSLFMLSGCAMFNNGEPYVIEEKGRFTLRTTFDKKMEDPSEQWRYALDLKQKEKEGKASRAFLYLARRWPNSVEAPMARRARADLLYAENDYKDAFKEYQELIDSYADRMTDYDVVLSRQFDLSVGIMNRKRFRWFFGGFYVPEYSVEYFEKVIRNGPQWSRAPEAQHLIGTAYEKADEWELAITAYSVLGYRYPNSSFAEGALMKQIECLEKLHKEYPNSPDVLDRLVTATTLFLTTYPESTRKNEVVDLRNRLYEVKAQKAYDRAFFYAKVPKKAQAAILCYKKMIEEYPRSKLVPEAEKRIAELEAHLADPYMNRL